MNTYLFSIHKRWNDLIFIELIKEAEVRKTSPKPPFKAIIYEPKNGGGCGKVIGEFICDKVKSFCIPYPAYFGELGDFPKMISQKSCLSFLELHHYLGNKQGYALEITAPKLYNKPKELCDYKTVRFVRGYHKKNETMIERLQNSKRVEVTYVSKAPQSYMRIQDAKED